MATEQQLATAREYFESNPGEGVLHISTDGQVFFQKNYNDGAVHQRRIDPAQKMTTIFRKEIEKTDATDSTPSNGEVPVEKMTKAQLFQYLLDLGVETTGKEKVDQLRQMATDALAAADAGDDEDSDQDDNE